MVWPDRDSNLRSTAHLVMTIISKVSTFKLDSDVFAEYPKWLSLLKIQHMGKTIIVTIFTAFMQTLLDGVSSLSDLYRLTPQIPKSCLIMNIIFWSTIWKSFHTQLIWSVWAILAGMYVAKIIDMLSFSLPDIQDGRAFKL